MGAPVETEVKLRVEGPEAAREALARLGAVLSRPRQFEDNQLFDDRRGSLRQAGVMLRLRRTAQGGVLTYKGPRTVEGGIKSREERETAVENSEAVEAILASLGLRPVFRYQKYRETYFWQGQEIVIDETPIGTFLEIEGDAEGIRNAAQALGYSASDFLSESYVGLFVAAGGQGDMVFP